MTPKPGEWRGRRYVRLTVSDTGGGMSTEARNRAFEPFFTTKPEAAGLGLTSVAVIIGRLGGWIDVRQPPRGTRVDIYLPVLAAREG